MGQCTSTRVPPSVTEVTEGRSTVPYGSWSGMHERPAVARSPESRAFVDEVLAELRSARWQPRAWLTFLWRCTARSARQVGCHPRAALEVTVLHVALLPLARRSTARLAVSWALAITHLGLLGSEAHSIGAANALSLLRANLPT